MPEPVLDLMKHVQGAVRESDFPNQRNGYFASKNTLRAVTDLSVAQTIRPNSPRNRNLVEFISREAREIFAIGIFMGLKKQQLVELVRLFRKHQKTDGSLPISENDMMQMWPGPTGRDSWLKRSFKTSQHLFRAQDFPRRTRFSVIYIGPDTLLPILKSKQMCRGRFGTVYKVTLHEDFLDSDDPIRKVRRHNSAPPPLTRT